MIDGSPAASADHLDLAAALQSDEPPGRSVDRVTDGDQPVVLVDQALLVGQGDGQTLAVLGSGHHRTTGVGMDHHVVVEHAVILSDHLELLANGGKRLPVDGVGVDRGDYVRPGFVNGVMDAH